MDRVHALQHFIQKMSKHIYGYLYMYVCIFRFSEGRLLLGLLKNTQCLQVPRAKHLLTSVLLAMAPKVWMHKPAIPGLLVVRIVEKHPLSTAASREALLTRVLLAMAPKVWLHKPAIPGLLVVRIVENISLSTGASREAPVDKCAPRHGA